MAKEVVEVDEGALKDMIIGDMSVYGKMQKEQTTSLPPRAVCAPAPTDLTEAAPPSSAVQSQRPRTASRPRSKREEPPCEYRERYLMPTPCSLRSQTYIHKEIYDRIKRFLPVIAPNASICGYISTILSEHLDLHAEQINEIYEKEYVKPF